MAFKVHNIQGQHSHVLIPYGADGHSVTSNFGNNRQDFQTFTLTMLYGSVLFEGQMVPMVHIRDAHGQGLAGFYYLWFNYVNCSYNLIHCEHPPDGYLKVYQTVNCHVITIQLMRVHEVGDLIPNPYLAYDNYCKDLRSWQYYHLSMRHTWKQLLIES